MNTKDLLYYNGFGGFSKEGKEYVISTGEDFTPLPWSHIMANEQFGCVVTANGGGYVWSQNSRENKLTRWSNDWVEDAPSEKLWIIEEGKDPFYLLPYQSLKDFVVMYGFGYASFQKETLDFLLDTCIFVPLKKSKKVYQIKLKNLTDETKSMHLQYQVVPVLGVNREETKKHLLFQFDKNKIMIQNFHRETYAKETVVVGSSLPMEEYQEENQILTLSIPLVLKAQEEKCFIIEIGVLTENEEVLSFQEADEEKQKVIQYWQEKTSLIQVKTPVESMNIMLNGWLLYQTMVSRLWGRTSFYQAGGAFGFRDQLQDSLILLYYAPELARKQILYHVAHQFEEGDVLHWWHPEKDNGIRTRYSDDLLWLPYVLYEYLEKTNDIDILKEEVPYVKMELLKDNENEKYENTTKTQETESVFMHAKRAIEKSLSFGPHGLPHMGSGDWNDGMNHVMGESVWLGFFLYEVLKRFCKLCEIVEDREMEKYLRIMEQLRKNLNEKAWDGAWYQRAFFQDGKAIGSHENEECKIDGISQSWAVISGAGDSEKQKEAMKSFEEYLVDKENQLIRLLTPAFHGKENNPGYIKNYLPGVRENGGQYTHGAVWSILAMAKLREREKTSEFFRFLNPIEHARTKESVMKYKVEPYVVVADIYDAPNMVGRGGWSWYTGSSSWLFMAGLEAILGVQKKGERLYLHPCIPKEWESFRIKYQYASSLYEINVYQQETKDSEIRKIYLDNDLIDTNMIILQDDQKTHRIDIIMN